MTQYNARTGTTTSDPSPQHTVDTRVRTALDKMSLEELTVARKAIEDEPGSRNPPGELFLFTPKVRKRLDRIDRLIQFRTGEARKARGEKINQEGYSGRQTNRRR